MHRTPAGGRRATQPARSLWMASSPATALSRPAWSREDVGGPQCWRCCCGDRRRDVAGLETGRALRLAGAPIGARAGLWTGESANARRGLSEPPDVSPPAPISTYRFIDMRPPTAPGGPDCQKLARFQRQARMRSDPPVRETFTRPRGRREKPKRGIKRLIATPAGIPTHGPCGRRRDPACIRAMPMRWPRWSLCTQRDPSKQVNSWTRP